MAYIKNEQHYVWRGGGEKEDHIYITFKEEEIMAQTNSEIQIPVTLFDELVVMRFAQLVEGMAVGKIQKRAWKKHEQQSGAQSLGRIMGKVDVAVEESKKGGVKKKDGIQ